MVTADFPHNPPLPDDSLNDTDLVAQAIRDPRAFALLYRRYLGPIYRYCAFRLGTKEAAEDATSQVFLKTVAALDTYRGQRSFRSWLFTIAHNVVIDYYRRRPPDRPLSDAMSVIDPDLSPEARVLADEQRREVHWLLEQLPADQRQILALRLAGLTGAEIAEILGRSPGAIKIAQVRAYARLRTILGIAIPSPIREESRCVTQ